MFGQLDILSDGKVAVCSPDKTPSNVAQFMVITTKDTGIYSYAANTTSTIAYPTLACAIEGEASSNTPG
jgi:hypothetical protein